jgi:hypothetical protein
LPIFALQKKPSSFMRYWSPTPISCEKFGENFVTEKYRVMIAQIWHVNGCPSPDPFHAGVLGDILLLKIYMVGTLLGQVRAICASVATGFPMGCHTNQWVAIPTNGLCRKNLAIFCH